MATERGYRMTMATAADCAELAPRLRPGDLREALLSHGGTPEEALAGSVALSTEAWAVRAHDGELLFLAGYFTPDGTLAMPWAMTGAGVERRKKTFVRACRRILARLEGFAELANYVDAGNAPAKRFLERLGFEVAGEPLPLGPADSPFLPFSRRKTCAP